MVLRGDACSCWLIVVLNPPATGLISAAPGRRNSGLQASAKQVEGMVRVKMEQKEYIILCLEDSNDWSNATSRRMVMQARALNTLGTGAAPIGLQLHAHALVHSGYRTSQTGCSGGWGGARSGRANWTCGACSMHKGLAPRGAACTTGLWGEGPMVEVDPHLLRMVAVSTKLDTRRVLKIGSQMRTCACAGGLAPVAHSGGQHKA